VLPGTGGLTRVTDKRKVRRDRADVFSTVADGIKGERAVEWGLIDGLYPMSKYEQVIGKRLEELAARSDRPGGGGITLAPLEVQRDDDETRYRYVTISLDRDKRIARVNVAAPDGDEPSTPDAMLESGGDFWALRTFRELSDALLELRVNEVEIGTMLLTTSGDAEKVLAIDRTLEQHADHWLVREVIHYIKRTLKRLDLTAMSIIALIEPGSCFAGTLFELALAADRSYMLDDPDDAPAVALSPMNAGPYKMSNGLTRLETRFLADLAQTEKVLAHDGPFEPIEAEEEGLVTFAPDDIDWEDDVRFGIEERVSLSPDALTGMEANLRFAGPETMETKIFGRLTAWQNWIFQRPNAVGESGALKVYGQAGKRPEFDWRRT
jgi:benzoyl-CoA-dihydrodiol lyase